MTYKKVPVAIHGWLFIDEDEVDELLAAGIDDDGEKIETERDAIRSLVWSNKPDVSDVGFKEKDFTFDLDSVQ